jgi:hypothetical protein
MIVSKYNPSSHLQNFPNKNQYLHIFDLGHLLWKLQTQKQKSHLSLDHVYHSTKVPNVGES